MKKFKKKFLLTGLALAVPLLGAIASACSEVSQDGPITPPAGGDQSKQNPPAGGDQSKQNPPAGGDQSKRNNNIGSLENLPMFIKLTK